MSIKIFADGADLNSMLEHHKNNPAISGFTTNPSLMRQAGVSDYTQFAQEALDAIPDTPISFEVFSDELDEMEKQARKIASWGKNVYVKIPVTNTKGISTTPLIDSLSKDRIQLNITALFTLEQVQTVIAHLQPNTPSIISVFAGRIANTGIDPMPIMKEAVKIASTHPTCEILWASTREALNIKQAENCGCHIITVPFDLLKVMKNFEKDLTQYSLETVNMFYQDAKSAGYTL